jgi:hypothetical protein
MSSLRPSVNGFSDKVYYSLNRTEDKGMRPLKWTTLVEDYPEVHKALKFS